MMEKMDAQAHAVVASFSAKLNDFEKLGELLLAVSKTSKIRGAVQFAVQGKPKQFFL